MSSSITHPDVRPLAATAAVVGDRLSITLRDGRELSVPIEWFSWLAGASEVDRANLRIVEGGLGLWWEHLDEGLSVPGLMGLPDSQA